MVVKDAGKWPFLFTVVNMPTILKEVLLILFSYSRRLLSVMNRLHAYSYFVRFKIFTAVTVNNGVFWDITPVALVRIDISEERSASFIRMTRIDELGTKLAL
jgi:hypothetical protein